MDHPLKLETGNESQSRVFELELGVFKLGSQRQGAL